MPPPPPAEISRKPALAAGFTLIELAIVLVIIGLIVGGVLVGQNLIQTAGVRATISQIEKYNTAANAFRGKYGSLPGDIPNPDATNFGFVTRGQYAGEGDGNGVIEGMGYNGAAHNSGYNEGGGETSMFWVDLSTAHLIDGSFNTATPSTVAGNVLGPITATSSPSLDAYFPAAKLGNGNYILVWSGGNNPATYTTASNGVNYFGLWGITSIGVDDFLSSLPSLTVAQAYQIDVKTDDGMPTSGTITAFYVGQPGNGAFGFGPSGTGPYYHALFPGTGTAAAGSSTTCYDNGGNASNPMQYSIKQSAGSNVNCALSFRFQ